MEKQLISLGFKKYNKFYELKINNNTIQVIKNRVYLFYKEHNHSDSFYSKYSFNKVRKLIETLTNL